MIQCPYCGFIGTLDDFDCCGLTEEFDDLEGDDYGPSEGDLICNRCVEVFSQPKETQKELFT